MRTHALALLIALLGGLGLVACGDGDTGGDASPQVTDVDAEQTDDGSGTAGADDVDALDPIDGTPTQPDGADSTVPVDADRAAAATANARTLYPAVLPPGALATEIDALLGATCPLATDTALPPADAAQAIVDLVPTDPDQPQRLPAMIMIAGRYVVDGGCGDGPRLDDVAAALLDQMELALRGDGAG